MPVAQPPIAIRAVADETTKSDGEPDFAVAAAEAEQ